MPTPEPDDRLVVVLLAVLAVLAIVGPFLALARAS